MAFQFVRSSKFRHVFGQALKRDRCFDNIRVSKSSWDSTFCAVNPKFLAVIVESVCGGAFLVLPLSKVGRIPTDYPLVGGHKGPVLDIAWSPHNDNIIASGSEDCVVKIWSIPDEGITSTMTKSVTDLVFHRRRVGLVQWHPSALNVLLTAGSDNQVVIWNAGTGEIITHISAHSDSIYSACFNWDGSQLVTTSRDKKIRVIDPRTGVVKSEAMCHNGSKCSRAIFLRQGLIFTTGFSRTSDRQYSLRSPNALDQPIVVRDLDTSNGVIFPFYDPDTNIVYLCGKGDAAIRYFEITDEAPYVHYINAFQASESQRAIGMMPKRGCDLSCCEIAKLYRFNNSGHCQIISMTVPRKSDLFQEDLYPDTRADRAAVSAEEWAAGKDADPVLFSLKLGQVRGEALKSAIPKRTSVLFKETCSTTSSFTSATESGVAGEQRYNSESKTESKSERLTGQYNVKKITQEINEQLNNLNKQSKNLPSKVMGPNTNSIVKKWEAKKFVQSNNNIFCDNQKQVETEQKVLATNLATSHATNAFLGYAVNPPEDNRQVSPNNQCNCACHNSSSNVATKKDEKDSEMNAEIMKLKSIILQHEKRLHDLENARILHYSTEV